MDETRKKFLGLVYLIIGGVSLILGMSFVLEVLRFDFGSEEEFLIYIIPAFVLTGITFFLGIKCIR